MNVCPPCMSGLQLKGFELQTWKFSREKTYGGLEDVHAQLRDLCYKCRLQCIHNFRKCHIWDALFSTHSWLLLMHVAFFLNVSYFFWVSGGSLALHCKENGNNDLDDDVLEFLKMNSCLIQQEQLKMLQARHSWTRPRRRGNCETTSCLERSLL